MELLGMHHSTINEAPILQDVMPPLDAVVIFKLQQIVGTFLYYDRAVNATILVALGTIAEEQTKVTTNTAKAAQ